MARKAPTTFLNAARKGGKTRVSLIGTEDLERAIKRLSEDVQGEILRDAVDDAAEIMRDVASQLAPHSADGSWGHEPGFLAKNIMTERQWTRTQDTAATDVGMEKKEAWYGRFPELGTSYQPAQPFLRPAFDSTKEDMIAAIDDSLRKSILRGIR